MKNKNHAHIHEKLPSELVPVSLEGRSNHGVPDLNVLSIKRRILEHFNRLIHGTLVAQTPQSSRERVRTQETLGGDVLGVTGGWDILPFPRVSKDSLDCVRDWLGSIFRTFELLLDASTSLPMRCGRRREEWCGGGEGARADFVVSDGTKHLPD